MSGIKSGPAAASAGVDSAPLDLSAENQLQKVSTALMQALSKLPRANTPNPHSWQTTSSALSSANTAVGSGATPTPIVHTPRPADPVDPIPPPVTVVGPPADPTRGPATRLEDAAKVVAKKLLRRTGLRVIADDCVVFPLAVVLGTLALLGVARVARAVSGSVTFTTSALSFVYGSVFHKMWVARQLFRLALWTVAVAFVYSQVNGIVVDVGPQSPEVTRFLALSEEFSKTNISIHDAALKLVQVAPCFKRWHHAQCRAVEKNVLRIAPTILSVYKNVLVSDRLSFSGKHGLNMSYRNRSMPLFKVREIRKDNATDFERLYAVYEHLSEYLSHVRPFNKTTYDKAGVWDATRMVLDHAVLYLPGMEASAPLPLESFHNIPSDEAVIMFHVDMSKKAGIVSRKNKDDVAFWRNAHTFFSYTRTSGSVISVAFPHFHSVAVFSHLACAAIGRWIDNLGAVSTDVFLDDNDFCLIGTCPDDTPQVSEVDEEVYQIELTPSFFEQKALPTKPAQASDKPTPVSPTGLQKCPMPAPASTNQSAPCSDNRDCDKSLEFVIDCAKKRREFVREHICKVEDLLPAVNYSTGPFFNTPPPCINEKPNSWTYSGLELTAYFIAMRGACWTVNVVASYIPMRALQMPQHLRSAFDTFVPQLYR